MPHSAFQRGRQMRLDGLQQLDEYLGVACDYIAGIQIIFLAGEIADQAAGLDHQQAAGRDVPGIQADLEEAVGAARRQPGQVQRGGTGTAQAGSLLHQGAEHPV